MVTIQEYRDLVVFPENKTNEVEDIISNGIDFSISQRTIEKELTQLNISICVDLLFDDGTEWIEIEI